MISTNAIEKAKQNAKLQAYKNRFREYYTRGLGQCENKQGMIRKIQEFRKSELAKEIQDFCMPELEGNTQEECDYYESKEGWSSHYRNVWNLPLSQQLNYYQRAVRKSYNDNKRVYAQFYMPLYGIPRHRKNPCNMMEPSCSTILESQYRRCLKQISIVLSMPKEKWDKYEVRRIAFCLEVEECPCNENTDPEKRYPRETDTTSDQPQKVSGRIFPFGKPFSGYK